MPSGVYEHKKLPGLVPGEVKFCKGGCGKVIEWREHYRLKGIPDYIHGHSREGKLSWNSGLTKSIDKHIIKQGISGEKHHSYKDGHKEKEEIWKNGVRQRFNGTCIKCGKTEELKKQKNGRIKSNLDTHHIFDKKSTPNMRFDQNNGACLCRGCHTKLHIIYGNTTNDQNYNDFIRLERL